MKKIMTMLPVFLFVMFVFSGMASAHVKVHPQEVAQDTYQTFTVIMPSEKEKANTTQLKLQIPDGVTITGVEPKPGWQHQFEKDDTGKITTIIWKAQNEGLTPNEFVELKMQGKVSDDAEKLRYKAYQTYDNGDVVKWIKDQQSDYPASVTQVNKNGDKAQTNERNSFDISFYLAITALVIGIIALIVAAVRKHKD